jgi:tetratricopeptide (TPR) repeat protein
VALEHDLRWDQANALRGLRIVHSHTNALQEALATVRQELSLWRDMGLAHWEASALEGMSIIQNHLGRSAESLRTLHRAQAISNRLGDPVSVAISQYHLANGILYHDDASAQQSIDLAQQALDTFRHHRQPGWVAATLEIIGYACWVDDRYAEALDALEEAEKVTRRLGELAFLPELLAYQGLAHLGLGEVEQATVLTRHALMLLAQGGVSEEVVPEILYAHAVVLLAVGCTSQARAYLRRAYHRVLDGAATFEEEPARQAYFHRNPTMRRLMHDLQVHGLAPESGAGMRTVQLPAAYGDGTLRVVWTVDAGPADVAIEQAEGAIALRRARLSRLLSEAQAQGGSPTVADLAEVLEVSSRTIQRDLAALRRE